MSQGMLIDTTRCIGCRSCQAACKSWNCLPSVQTTFTETGSNPRYLSSNTFTRIIFREVVRPEGEIGWYFVKRQCMHCNDPACASVCPVGALRKNENGPVTYDDSKCIGCRYCLMACPFQIPKFQWESAVPLVRKCTFCADRLAIGLSPSCAATCPTQAILFGEKSNLLKDAWHRIGARPDKYVPQVYGEKTAGGTSMLYLTSVPFDQLGLESVGFRTDLADVPYGLHGREWMSKVPFIAVVAGGLALGLTKFNERRNRVKATKEE
jgi:formate dehydrogenase iron-sulfur subunit